MTRVAAVPPIRGLRDGSSCTDRERVPNCLGYFALPMWQGQGSGNSCH